MIYNEIRCDKCSKKGDVSGEIYLRWRAHFARYQLANKGWATGLKGGTDICPECRGRK